MPESESLGIRITVASRLEKKRPLINGRTPTPAEIDAINDGVEVVGLEYEVYEIIDTEPEEMYVTQEQLSFLQENGFVQDEPEGSTEDGSNGRGS